MHVRLAAFFLTLVPCAVHADELVLDNGRRLKGTLQKSANEWLYFVGAKAVAWSDIHEVRYPEGPTPTPSVPLWFQFHLRHGDRVTGALDEILKDQVRCRLAWGKSAILPRSALLAITPVDDRLPIMQDDFEEGMAAWKVHGTSSTAGDRKPGAFSGLRFLLLDRAGQAAEHEARPPLSRGRCTFHFHVVPTGRGSTLFARFGGSEVALRLDDGRARVGTETSWPLTDGWHLFQLDWQPRSWRLAVDDLVLGSGAWKTDAPFTAFGCRQEGPGALAIDAVRVCQPLTPMDRPPGDVNQDEVWLRSGDQVFGKLTRADDRALALETRFGPRAFRWSQLRGLFFGGERPAPKPAGAQWWARPGPGVSPDRLTGKLLEVQANAWVVQTELFGKVTFRAGQLLRMKK